MLNAIFQEHCGQTFQLHLTDCKKIVKSLEPAAS